MQPIAVGSLEELVSEAAQMPLLIPEADALREKLEAAQQLGGNVRRLLRLEQPADAGGPDPPPAARTGRRKLSATGHPPVDDVTLKVRMHHPNCTQDAWIRPLNKQLEDAALSASLGPIKL